MTIERIICETEEDWLHERLKSVGASESPILLGEGYAGTSELGLWAEKMGLSFPDRAALAERFMIGRHMEHTIAAVFESKYGIAIKTNSDGVLIRNSDHLFMHATLDGTIDDKADAEFKNLSFRERREFIDGPQLKYVIQCQHQMAVSGKESVYLIAMIGGQEILFHVIQRNDRFIDNLINRCRKFWHHVENSLEPAAGSSLADAKAIELIHPEPDGSAIHLDDRDSQIYAELQQYEDAAKAIEKEVTSRKNYFRQKLGDHSYGALKNGGHVSLLKQTKPEHTVPETSYRVLRFTKKDVPKKATWPVINADESNVIEGKINVEQPSIEN